MTARGCTTTTTSTPSALDGPDGRDHRLRQSRATPTPGTCATRASTSSSGSAEGSKSRALAEEAGLRVADVADAVEGRRRDHDPRPGHGPEGGLRRRDRAEPPARPAADVRPRLQHPVRADQAAGRRSTSGWSRRRGPATSSASVYAAGGGVPALFAVEQDASGTARARTLAYARGARLDPRRRPRDDVQGGDRDRPLRRAGAPVRRRLGADQGRVRDARRGRLPARARLLRDDARAEADRRPDVPRRPQLHALQRQRHRRVRRLRLRPARRRGREGDDEGRPRRHPERLVREPLDRRPGGRRRRVPRAPAAGPGPPDRAGRRASCGPRWRSSNPVVVEAGEAQASAASAAATAAPAPDRAAGQPPDDAAPAGRRRTRVRIFDTTLRDGEQAPGRRA